MFGLVVEEEGGGAENTRDDGTGLKYTGVGAAGGGGGG